MMRNPFSSCQKCGEESKVFQISVFVAAALEGSDDIISSSRSAIFGGRGGGSSSLDFTVGIEES